MNKKELIKTLVEEFGYEKSDISLLTNAKLKKLIKQEQEDEKELQDEALMPVAKASKIKDDDVVLVMNGLGGSMTHRSDINGRVWKFRKFGQIEKFPYSEIQSIRNAYPKVLEHGWLVVLHKAVQEELGLTEMYKNILTPENVGEIFKKDVAELELFVDNLPQGMKATFVAKAKELMEANELFDTRVISFIETKFGLSLKDNAPLSDIV